ncbi:MAG: biopolymer transporter ExbD [Paludibacter sp.]|nr:biopolymer transporter ExbD [Paludibacter sp.]
MSKVKVARKSTLIDMTAMSDVTVLLLTFFMLTSTFVKKEPVQVKTPGSVSEIKIPETNILQILIDPSGKVFMSLDKQKDMIQTLSDMGNEYGIAFTPEEIQKFKLQKTFGVDIKIMKQFLAQKAEVQDAELQKYGIPTDSLNNQFKKWVQFARKSNGKDMTIAIKADQKTPYKVIKSVMNSLQDLNENRYNLITALKVESSAKKE